MSATRKSYVKSSDYESEEYKFSVSVTRGGKPFAGYDPKRTTSVEEDVMSWKNADHIHAWFVDNVQGGENDYGTYKVHKSMLMSLLSVCEKVLYGSHLVCAPAAFAAAQYVPFSKRQEAKSKLPKVIKNIAAAYKLLPLRDFGQYGLIEYGEAYLQAVEATREWAERMLIDAEANTNSELYYTSFKW